MTKHRGTYDPNAHPDLPKPTSITGQQHYHIPVSDQERAAVEQWSFNFHQQFGQKMKIPPRLFEDLRNAGVRMDWMEASESLSGQPPIVGG